MPNATRALEVPIKRIKSILVFENCTKPVAMAKTMTISNRFIQINVRKLCLAYTNFFSNLLFNYASGDGDLLETRFSNLRQSSWREQDCNHIYIFNRLNEGVLDVIYRWEC